MTKATGAENADAYRSALPPTSTMARKIEKVTLPPLNPNPRIEAGKRYNSNPSESGRSGAISRKKAALMRPVTAPISAVHKTG